MAKTKPPDPKPDALRRHGSLNPHPGRVQDPLFATTDFFDARDLVQVKYEMVRRVRVDGQPVSRSAAAFGVSRPTLYQAQAAVARGGPAAPGPEKPRPPPYQAQAAGARGGLAALVPKKPGPRRAHKLSPEVVDFLHRAQTAEPSLRPPELARRVRARFGRT